MRNKNKILLDILILELQDLDEDIKVLIDQCQIQHFSR